MKILLKGIINKKKLLSNILITFFLFITFSSISIIIEYQNKLTEIEFSKKEYRLFTFENIADDTKYIDSYKDKIETMTLSATIDPDTGRRIENYSIVFNSIEDRNNFLEENRENYDNSVVSLVADMNSNLIDVFSIIAGFIILALFLLTTIFSTNYFRSLRKDISLFKVLGFRKEKIFLLLSAIFGIVYIILYIISYLITYLIYIVLGKLEIISDIHNIFSVNILFIFILILALSISLVISISNTKKVNDISILSID